MPQRLLPPTLPPPPKPSGEASGEPLARLAFRHCDLVGSCVAIEADVSVSPSPTPVPPSSVERSHSRPSLSCSALCKPPLPRAPPSLGAALWEAAQGYERLLNEETLRELTPSQLSTLHGAHMRMLDELQAAEWRTFQKVEQESKRRRIAEALRKEKEWD